LAVADTEAKPDVVVIALVSKLAAALGVPSSAKLTLLVDVSGVGELHDVVLISTSSGSANGVDSVVVCVALPTTQR
jgi:hypothetical protein